MVILNKYEIDFNKIKTDFFDILDGGNILSELIIKNVNFDNGKFYTFLPKSANFENICRIKIGGILPQNPLLEHIVNGRKSFYSYIPNNDDEICLILTNYLKMGFSCIMDDVTRSINDKYFTKHYGHLDRFIFLINNQIIYLLNDDTISLKIIKEILSNSSAFWHSLGILLDKKINFPNKEITLNELTNICDNIRIVFVNAYDGEGYVFWERRK